MYCVTINVTSILYILPLNGNVNTFYRQRGSTFKILLTRFRSQTWK